MKVSKDLLNSLIWLWKSDYSEVADQELLESIAKSMLKYYNIGALINFIEVDDEDYAISVMKLKDQSRGWSTYHMSLTDIMNSNIKMDDVCIEKTLREYFLVNKIEFI